MNGLWSIFSKYIQAAIFAASAFILGYHLFSAWLNLFIQTSDHALERSFGSLVLLFRVSFLFFYMGPIAALLMAGYFGKSIYPLSLSVHQDIFEFLASRVQKTDHALMAKLAGICAFWVSVRLVGTLVPTTIFYALLFILGDFAAIVIPPLIFLTGAAVTHELYKNYLKHLHSTGGQA